MADRPKPPSDRQRFLSQQAEVRARIGELKFQADNLSHDVNHVRGQLLNLDPLLTSRLRRRNKELQERMANLERALFLLLTDAGSSRTEEEEKTKREMLCKAAIEHFPQQNIDPHLWKDLES